MKILITGGAGYIGSFMTKASLDKGYEVVVVDNLERGHKESIDSRAKIILGELKDKKFVDSLFLKDKFDAVVHFAGYISMAESVSNPYLYFNNNVNASLNLIECMVKNRVNNLIFSSTAGVYGNPIKSPIREDHPKNPTNPYGESKLMIEKILAWYRKIYGLNFMSLRYFNACGGQIDGKIGERHSPETHLIPNAINAALNGTQFTLYGDDYGTPDGTCIRDYIHVTDLVNAHILAILKLKNDGGGFFYNVGTGQGHSNKAVVSMVEKTSGSQINMQIAKRRPGDVDVLIADPTLIKRDLGFKPKYSDLATIVKSAWEWHKKLKMKNFLFFILFFFLLALFFPLLVFAESSYVLPYPSSMPGSFAYKLHLIYENLSRYWYFGNFGQFEYNLKMADKYLVETKTLFDYKQYLLGMESLRKSNYFFLGILPSLKKAEKEGKSVSQKRSILKEAALKHMEYLERMDLDTPDIFIWEPEKSLPTMLLLKEIITKSIKIRKGSL